MSPLPAPAPLDDLLVVDLSRALAGPHAAMLLGDMGARVIKVEVPGRGDDSRSWGPPFVDAGSADHTAPAPGLESTYFLSCNRNKESLELDLRDETQRAHLERLLLRADIVIENFRPGVMDRFGLSFDRLREANPRLIILSITGFGHDGPEGRRAGYDQIVQGEAGLMSVTGPADGGPAKVGVPIADLLAGLHGVYGLLTALHERARTGRGRVVRTSLLASVVGVHAFQATSWTVAGRVPARTGNHHPAICPYGLFACADATLQMAVGNDGMWRALAAEFGLDRAEWATNAQRVGDRDAVIAAVSRCFGRVGAADVLARLDRIGIPAGRVRTIDEVYEWDQVRSQGLLIEVEHPALGPIELPGNPVRFDANAFAGGRERNDPPPTLGQHTEPILGWLAPEALDLALE